MVCVWMSPKASCDNSCCFFQKWLDLEGLMLGFRVGDDQTSQLIALAPTLSPGTG